MSPEDLATLETFAQGDGERRMSARCLRAIIAEIKALRAAERARDMFQREYGTVAA